MLKKIIGTTLAIMMIVSLFTITTSAVETGGIGYKVETDATVGAGIGTLVTVKVYYVVSDDEDIATTRFGASGTCIGYNDNYYKFLSDSREWGEHYEPIFKPESQINTGAWNVIKAGVAATPNDVAKGYTNAVIISQNYIVGVPEAKEGYLINPDCEIFTIKFEVIKTLEADAYIGIPEYTLAKQTQMRKYIDGKQKLFTASQMDNTDAIKKSNHVSANFATATKIRPNADNAANVDLGFTGSFLNAGLPIEFAGGTSTNVSAVGVELTVNGNTNSYQDNFVYENADGNGYDFRVALTGIPAENFNTPIKARMFVIFDGETYYSDYVYTTAAAHVGRLA